MISYLANMMNIMTRREASSSYIAFARSTKTYTTARIITISWTANAWSTMTFTASCYTSGNTDASITMTYWTA